MKSSNFLLRITLCCFFLLSQGELRGMFHYIKSFIYTVKHNPPPHPFPAALHIGACKHCNPFIQLVSIWAKGLRAQFKAIKLNFFLDFAICHHNYGIVVAG